MTDRMRVGIIGPGGRGIAVGSMWVRQGQAEIVCVSDIASDALERARGRLAEVAPSCEYYGSNAELLGRDDLDLVMVTTFDPYHAEPSIEVLEAGKNLFVEKPMTQTIEDARRVVEAWRKSGRLLIVDHELRYCDFIMYAKDKIEKGQIGAPRLAVTLDSCGRMGSFFRRARARTTEKIVSLTVQKGVHHLDLQSHLMAARPKRVFATGGLAAYGGDKPNDLTCGECDEADTCAYGRGLCGPGRPRDFAPNGLCVFAEEIDVNDHMTAAIEYENGARGSYTECFFTPEYKAEMRITGDEGQIDVLYKGGHTCLVRVSSLNSTTFEETLFSPSSGHGGGDFLFAGQVRQGVMENRQIRPDGLDGYYAVAVAASCHESCRTGEPVDIPSV